MKSRDFPIEMKYTKKISKKCRHVGFCDFRHRSCTQKVLVMIMRLLSTCTALFYCFLKKVFVISLFGSHCFPHINIEKLILSPRFSSN